jgi:formimidoylglutamate deiminase
MAVIYQPELLYTKGRFETGRSLAISDDGKVHGGAVAAHSRTREGKGAETVGLPHQAMLPGMIDVHSHSFQRTIRGAVESRLKAGPDFWSWRDAMYKAAGRFTPEELYTVARMAFLEMALTGVTTVGEFHYVHRDRDGSAYANPNEIALHIVRAAKDVGIRIALLRVAYVRAGYRKAPDPGQRRFIEPDVDAFLKNTDDLRSKLTNSNGLAWVGVAPHSIRAVPLDYLREATAWARAERLPVHMHVAEQPAENAACLDEYGATPFAFLDREGILDERFTAIHGIHLSDEEIAAVGRANAIVGACPTTERNLGDGILPADQLMRAGVRIAFGSDSLTQIDPLENARELEYNLRLQKLERAVLDTDDLVPLPQRLFEAATAHGAESLGCEAGKLAEGRLGDFFTVDLDDPSIAGSSPEELLAAIVFGLSRTAIRDVAVGGRLIVQNGRHPDQEEIVRQYRELIAASMGRA